MDRVVQPSAPARPATSPKPASDSPARVVPTDEGSRTLVTPRQPVAPQRATLTVGRTAGGKRSVERPSLTCEVCNAKVTELRRGRCWGCYTRWVESRPVGLGAACVICGDRRRSDLRQIELLRTWLPMCHNCAAKATGLMPMPQTLDEIRKRLTRERRASDRRVGRKDGRVFPRERRGLERRAVGHALGDDLLLLDDGDIIIIDAGDGEDTQIIHTIGEHRRSLPE